MTETCIICGMEIEDDGRESNMKPLSDGDFAHYECYEESKHGDLDSD